MRVGTSRISEIVRSLRIFSRLDESARKAVNIHDGLDSTLMILGNRLKGNSNRLDIAVIKTYGDLPDITCYAGQLNQVFMNLLANAIDAIDESFTDSSSSKIAKIYIQTTIDTASQTITISIRDNASGISPEVQNRIFDQFFTTKAVGKGTGLGLAISQEIITQKHGGKLTCQSIVGEGTEFKILLPISRN
jgi:signal transduction histidine kinase